jgi:hypothetical protein
MRRSQLQHVIYEIGRRFELTDFHVIGSAAILAQLPEPPEGALTATRDVDVIPPGGDERLADRISFVLGEASDFDAEHGYYAQGVSERTATYAPAGWKGRALPVRVERYTGWCMEAHDLVISKLGAGRDKDLEFARSLAALGLVEQQTLRQRLQEVVCQDEHRRLIEARVTALFPAVRPPQGR